MVVQNESSARCASPTHGELAHRKHLASSRVLMIRVVPLSLKHKNVGKALARNEICAAHIETAILMPEHIYFTS